MGFRPQSRASTHPTLPQQKMLHLAERVLRQAVDEDDVPRHLETREMRGDVLLERVVVERAEVGERLQERAAFRPGAL